MRPAAVRRAASGSTPTDGPRDRRAFVVGCAIGGAIALIAFVAVLHVGPGGFFRRETFANFYDAQADAWLHGHWNVPGNDLFIEGFRIGDKTYTYFGAWPSLLRLPVLAVTGGPYGHMTALSMTLAFAVALVGVSMLHWRLRQMFRPGRAVSRAECVLAGAVVLVAGCGTSLLFLGSRAWVYHEAILWGAAWALVAYERVIAFMVRPSRGRLVAASLFAALGFLSRASVGMGPLVALGIVLGGRLLRALHTAWTRRRTTTAAARSPAPAVAVGPDRARFGRIDWLGGADDGRSWVLPLLIAVLLPAAVYAYVNVSRFGTLFSVPWTRQVLALVNQRHQRILADNGGTYFGLKFAPTTLLQYLRPDALAPSPLFPWITFPHFRTPVIGSAKFDTLDVSTSVVASMPALCALGAVGIVGAVFPRVSRTPEARWLRVPLLGAVGGIGLTVAISYVAQRYLGDWVPLLVLAALIGIQVLLRRGEEARHRRSTRVWFVVVAVLAVFGIWVNGGLAVLYARLYAPQHDTDRLALLTLQHRLDIGGPHAVGRSDVLPARPAPAGTSWIVGDCASLYWSDGRGWSPVEGTAAGGWFRLVVRPDELSTGWQPLVTDRTPGNRVVVGIRRNEGAARGTVDLGLGTIGPDGAFVWPVNPKRLPFGPGAHRVDVVMNDALRRVKVTVDGTTVVQIGGAPLAARPGPYTVDPEVRQLPGDASLCRDLLG
ncbi:MAG TPA: hypothetical protein VGN59_16955 [Acidimicrobiia bacterium]